MLTMGKNYTHQTRPTAVYLLSSAAGQKELPTSFSIALHGIPSVVPQ